MISVTWAFVKFCWAWSARCSLRRACCSGHLDLECCTLFTGSFSISNTNGAKERRMANDYLLKFNKAFENRIRLGVMSILMVNDSVEFVRLKELLQVTDGNLASHL